MSNDFLASYFTRPLTWGRLLRLVLVLAAFGAIWWLWPSPKPPLRPVILLVNHYPMTAADKQFYRQANPYGFLLGLPSHKNLDPRILRQELEEVLGRRDFVFFIDQEGGSVNRIKQFDPSFPAPAAATFGKLAQKDRKKAIEETYEYGVRTGKFLKNLTVDVVFAPLAEVTPRGDSPHKSRYFSADVKIVEELSAAYAAGLAAGGVIPCYKHALGQSAETSDPHYERQVVALTQKEIRQQLLPPFASARRWPFLMTAHAYYTDIDPEQISTYSPAFYRFVREELQFDGWIVPDALNMASSGPRQFVSEGEQMNRALAAGADLVIPLFNLDANPFWMLEQIKQISNKNLRKFHQKLKTHAPMVPRPVPQN